MKNSTFKKIIFVLSIALGAGISYYIWHQSSSVSCQIKPQQDQITIDEYDEARDTQGIKDIFYKDYYWLYPDESYNVESHVGFMLKYKAPTEDPLYVGTLHVKVLRVNGEFAGFTAYHKETITRSRLLFLAIKKEFRKRGFGEMLARYAVNELKKMGAQTIVLVTRINNPAQNIYRRVGFKEASRDKEFLYMDMQVDQK